MWELNIRVGQKSYWDDNSEDSSGKFRRQFRTIQKTVQDNSEDSSGQFRGQLCIIPRFVREQFFTLLCQMK